MQFSIKHLPLLNMPQYVVFSDFDETYLAHDMNKARVSDLRRLEAFLLAHSSQSRILFGWVTGSNLKSVREKIDYYGLELIPHFIGSDLGTELHWFSIDNGQVEDQDWAEKVRDSGFSYSKVELVVTSLAKLGIYLNLQPIAYQGTYKRSYYLHAQDPEIDLINIVTIRSHAKALSINVGINRCNPQSGDPIDCYDVDFIPSFGGKRDIVKFILDKVSLSGERAFAFGDSGNDLPMLKEVSQGYLVANATPEAKSKHPCITKTTYADGILSIIQTLI
ncbi:MAG: HAD-IIB family hydrolase [Crocosphaera sp.]|nr:HAD-IIB family hydrolase [Crocosphaera sp.]